MTNKIISVLIICFLCLNLEMYGQRKYVINIDSSKEATYKTIDSTKLKLWIFNPDKHQLIDNSPAIVFFFGGGWNEGSPSQFVKHCEYLAARGMVAIVADYRVRSRHSVAAKTCVTDAKSAIRWVREHASELGIDSDRIAAGGGSAGGHLAAACAILPKFDDENENSSISSKPNALILFNPVLVVGSSEALKLDKNKTEALEKRLGTTSNDISPYHNIVGKLPPTIIFHGTGDKTVPFETAELFNQKMHEFENQCILIAYEGQPHGFFNYGNKFNSTFIDTVHKMDEFLVSLGYLKAPPTSVIKY